MDINKELQLEQVASRALRNAAKLNLAPPIFELYASLLAISLAIVMFLVPGLLELDYVIYGVLVSIMPQGGWGIAFFIAGTLSAIGMLINQNWLRILALMGLSALYGFLTTVYGFTLPNFGFILMLWLTVFTVASIPLVKYTGIWNVKSKGEKHNDSKTN